MNGFIKHFMALSGIVGVFFGAYFYLSSGPAESIKENRADLERKIESERGRVLAYVDEKDAAKTQQIQAINQNFNDKFGIMMKMLERIDDRVYDLQREKSQSAENFGAQSTGG